VPLQAPHFTSLGAVFFEPVSEAAQKIGTPIAAVFVDGDINRTTYERTFDNMKGDRVDGLLVSDSAKHVTNRVLITELAAQRRMPAIYPYRDFVDVGGLMAYSVDLADVFHRVADITDQILKGTKPRDIPFYQQIKFELVLNRITAKSLGLELPATLLPVADEVIE
jgi:putative tryptophan/tyrosine transport system substrate-binding protein